MKHVEMDAGEFVPSLLEVGQSTIGSDPSVSPGISSSEHYRRITEALYVTTEFISVCYFIGAFNMVARGVLSHPEAPSNRSGKIDSVSVSSDVASVSSFSPEMLPSRYHRPISEMA